MTFKEIGLIDPILKALDNQGYKNPTPIQAQAIPILLKGTDLLGCAQTGTGKTAAFAIPIIQHIENDPSVQSNRRKIKALVVTPTRELAIQIADSFTAYGKFTKVRNTVIFGGVKQGSQVAALKKGVDVLVATPGRLLDLMNQGFVKLHDLDYFVLDEADQMLDMGFIHDIKKLIAKIPEKRQSLFFSATMPTSIVQLSKTILGTYETVTIKPEQATAERVEQALYYVARRDKVDLLTHIVNQNPEESILVFSRTKHGSDKIVRKLQKSNIKAEAIHGNKSQNARQKALGHFKDGKTKVLIATDIAARGIDVAELSLVINFDLPNVPETYVHRIGRTGRAKASGIAISFCSGEEKPLWKDIIKLIRQDVPVVDNHPFPDDGTELPRVKQQQRPPRNKNRQQGDKRRSSQGGKKKFENKSRNKNQRRSEEDATNTSRDKRGQAPKDGDSRGKSGSTSKTHGKPQNKQHKPKKKFNNKAKSTSSNSSKPKRDYLRLLD